ncbi:unnamed protein product, partial [Protopolystoma xenopodis]
MIETECFDDLNEFYSPDGTIVDNLNPDRPPPQQTRTTTPFFLSCLHANRDNDGAAIGPGTQSSHTPKPPAMATATEIPGEGNSGVEERRESVDLKQADTNATVNAGSTLGATTGITMTNSAMDTRLATDQLTSDITSTTPTKQNCA